MEFGGLEGEPPESVAGDLLGHGGAAGLFAAAVGHEIFAEGRAELDVAVDAFLCIFLVVFVGEGGVSELKGCAFPV